MKEDKQHESAGKRLGAGFVYCLIELVMSSGIEAIRETLEWHVQAVVVVTLEVTGRAASITSPTEHPQSMDHDLFTASASVGRDPHPSRSPRR